MLIQSARSLGLDTMMPVFWLMACMNRDLPFFSAVFRRNKIAKLAVVIRTDNTDAVLGNRQRNQRTSHLGT